MGRGQGGLWHEHPPQWAAVTDAKERPGKQSAKPTQLAPVPRHEAKGFVAFGLDLRSPQG